jgi:hypothetical protein
MQLAEHWSMPAESVAEEARAESGGADGNTPGLTALMAGDTISRADAKEQTADSKDQPPPALPTAAPSEQQAAFLAGAASAGAAIVSLAALCAPAPGSNSLVTNDADPTQAQHEGRNASIAPQLPGTDNAPAKGALDAMVPPGSAAAAASQRMTVLAQETHIAPAQLQRAVQGALDRAPRNVTSQPTATLEQDAGAGTQTGDSESPSTHAVGRSIGAMQEPSAWDEKSNGDEGTNEDLTSSHPGSVADGAVTSVARDGVRSLGAFSLPTQQVAGRIVAAALAAQQDGGRIDISSARAVSSPVIKILHLELQPADLGIITIRMSLKQDGIDIRLEASRRDTADMLRRDQEGLVKLLTSAGYHMDGLTVTASAAHGSQAPDARASAFLPSSTQDQWGSSQPDARSSGGRQSDLPDPRAFRGKQNDNNNTSGAVPGAGGDLYV